MNLTLASAAGQAPSALQWTLAYLPSDILDITVTPTTLLQTSDKNIICNQLSGSETCLAMGLNTSVIPDGIVAVVTFTPSPTAGAVPSTLINSAGSDMLGNSITISPFTVTPGTPTQIPVTIMATPLPGTGVTQTFLITITDADGFANIANLGIGFLDVAPQPSSCYAWLNFPSKALFLINDDGSSYHNPPATFGNAGSVENSYCRIDTSTVTVSGTGSVLSLALPVTFKTSGVKNIYAYSTNASGVAETYHALGSWVVPAASPTLSVAKTHNGTFTQGQTGSYTIAVSNISGSATDGTPVTVVDTLPSGLAASAMSGAGWNCNLSTTSCTRNDSLAGNASYPAIGVTVNIAPNAPAILVNQVNVSGGGGTSASATDTVAVARVAATISATGGTPQSTTIGTAFASALQATVKDSSGAGIAGLTVTFTPPAFGAGGTFAGGINSAITNNAGVATSPVLTANNVAGGYTVTASIPGVIANASFSLTNTTSAPSGAAATFVTADTTTQGNWRSAYGTDGYNIIGDLASNPSYAAPSAVGQASYTWMPSTSDLRALQKASSPSDRIAGTWYAANSFLVDSNITDGAPHQVALYFLDWDTTTRRQTIDVLDSNGTVLNTQTLASSFNGGVYLVWNVAGHVKFRVTSTGGINAVLSGLFFGGPSPLAAASFLKTDTTTQGNWRSAYGVDGYNIIGDLASNPSYAAPSAVGQASYTWMPSTSDLRALQKASSPSDRIAGTWYAANSFLIDSHITDAAPHQVALYFLDWDTTTRRETIDVLDPNGTVLNTQTLGSSFNGGVYLVWNVAGHVKFRVTSTGSSNAVLSGLFFGGPSPLAAASFLKTDTTTQGNWRTAYGVDGYNIIGDLASNPSYAAPSALGQASFTWMPSTSDVRALQKASNPSDRIAGTWYAANSFLIDSNITDVVPHQVALYFLDWDSTTRRETIEVLDPNGVILDTQTLNTSFNGGRYLVWNVTGHVRFRVTFTGGSNAVVSGLFFGGPDWLAVLYTAF